MATIGNYNIPTDHLGNLLLTYRMEFPDTEIFEQIAINLQNENFNPQNTARFVRQICRWGGYYGLSARILNQNGQNELVAAFQEAYNHLNNGNSQDALIRLNNLRQLGRPSFASKFLRFLAPHQAVVLDRVISENTGIPLTPDGYHNLINQCHEIVNELNLGHHQNPIRNNNLWVVADVEAAFFAHMQGF